MFHRPGGRLRDAEPTPHSMLEIPFFDWVTRYMALNQSRSGSLLDAK